MAGAAQGPPGGADRVRQASADGDHALAVALADSLLARAPGHPDVVLTRAVALAAAGRDGEAVEALRVLLRWDARYVQRALQDATLARLRERLEVDVDALAERAGRPLARGRLWATIPERDLVPEGTTWDPGTRSLLIGSLNKSKVVAVAEDGSVSDRVATGLGSVVGIHVDAARGVLWVASTPRFDRPSDTTTAALLAFEAASGAFLRRVDAPPGPSFLNDLTTGPNGTVYLTDSRGARVLELPPGGDALRSLAALGPLRAPNGITISDDGRLLFVSDYDHVQVLSLGDGRSWRLRAPDSVNMAGIDGLAYAGGAFIAHHPLALWRIVRYRLDPEARRVVGVEFIEKNTPDARTSTTGEVVGDAYYYIGNGQIDRMNAGTIDSATMQPVRLYRAALPPPPGPVVAVALSGADSVAFFDGQSLERLATLPVGDNPHEVAAVPDGRTLYVANSGDGTISVLEASTPPRVRTTWRLPEGISAHDVAVGDAGIVWAISGQPPILLGLDAMSGGVLHRHALGRPGSWMVDERGPGRTLTIAHLEGGGVTLLDPLTGGQRFLPGREGEIDAAASPDLSRVWSVNSRTGDVTVFDAATGSELMRRSGGTQASRVVFGPRGRVALVVDAGEATVVAHDVVTAEPVAAVAVGPGPKVIALGGDGRLAYVTHPGGALTMIDVPSMTVLRSVALPGTPDGVAVVEPQGR